MSISPQGKAPQATRSPTYPDDSSGCNPIAQAKPNGRACQDRSDVRDPKRTDGGDLLALCQENLVHRCDLVEGVRRDLLCRFRYFGVPDSVDYRNIPWRNARFLIPTPTSWARSSSSRA